MDRALIILIAVVFVLGLYAIRSRRRVKKELEAANSRRREELIQQALDRWFEFDLLEALDALYHENVQRYVAISKSNQPLMQIDNGNVYTKESLDRDNNILMAEMIRLRKEQIEFERARIERESGFEVIHSAQV